MTRTSSTRSDWVILIGLGLICWVYFGYAYGTRGIVHSDDAYFTAVTVLDQLPNCIQTPEMWNPFRPLYPTLPCFLNKVFGVNTLIFQLIPFIVYWAIAFIWVQILRSTFSLPVWMGFLAGIIVVSYPDNGSRLRMVGGISMVSVLLILLAGWLILNYWDKPHGVGITLVSCLLVLVSFLIYELFIGIWIVGLPLALLYKVRSRQLNTRTRRLLFRTILCIAITFLLCAVWRLYVPHTYVPYTILVGQGAKPIGLNPFAFVLHILDAYLLLVRAWTPTTQTIQSQIEYTNLQLTAIMVFFSTLVVFCVTYVVQRLERGNAPLVGGQTPEKKNKALALFVGGMVLIPIGLAPYLVIDVDFSKITYPPYGIPFGVSLLALAFLQLNRRRLTRVAILIFILVLVGYMTAYSGAASSYQQRRSALICDFMLRFTKKFPQLPTGYVVISDQYLFGDAKEPDHLTISNWLAMSYVKPGTSYRYGFDGFNGYMFIEDPLYKFTDRGIAINWPEQAIFLLHRFSIPPKYVPSESAIIVHYEPFTGLNIVNPLQSTYQERTANSMAYQNVAKLCEWSSTIAVSRY